MNETERTEEKKLPEEAPIDAGNAVYSWESWEFLPHERSKRWYTGMGIATGALIIWALLTQNFLFAIIILMIAVIFLAIDLRKPQRIQIHITEVGIVIDDRLYTFEEMKDFSIIYAPPEIKWLYIDFQKSWLPMITVPLEDADPIIVRDALLPYAIENIERTEETLTDLIRRLYKL